MTKKLIIINGTMGVGKTTTSKEFLATLQKAVWLDGDWCWMMNPWDFNDENKSMVIANISFLLKNYLSNPNFEFVIFSWVIPQEEIFNLITDNLGDLKYQLYKISLICSPDALTKRMSADGRTSEGIEESVQRMANYHNMSTYKIDTSNLNVTDIVDLIRNYVGVKTSQEEPFKSV